MVSRRPTRGSAQTATSKVAIARVVCNYKGVSRALHVVNRILAQIAVEAWARARRRTYICIRIGSVRLPSRIRRMSLGRERIFAQTEAGPIRYAYAAVTRTQIPAAYKGELRRLRRRTSSPYCRRRARVARYHIYTGKRQKRRCAYESDMRRSRWIYAARLHTL